MTKAQADYLISEFGTKNEKVTIAWVVREKALQVCDNRTGEATIWNATDYHETMDFLKTI